MNIILKQVSEGFVLSGSLKADAIKFLEIHDCHDTIIHINKVAQEAKELAKVFSENEEHAFCAGLLHDISAVFPHNKMLDVAVELGINVLPEERACPAILHQKISQAIAKEIFKIDDQDILNAIGCHTTLRRDATTLDKITFIADKIKWDQNYHAPFHDELSSSIKISLDEACYCYLKYLWNQKEHLAVIHPWMEGAYFQLNVDLNR